MILDTVAFVRLLRAELSADVLLEMEAAPVLWLSAVSLFEINQKVRIGRLDMAAMGPEEISKIETHGVTVVPVTPEVMAEAASMSWIVDGRDHRDPFDRMIAATALNNGLPVATWTVRSARWRRWRWLASEVLAGPAGVGSGSGSSSHGGERGRGGWTCAERGTAGDPGDGAAFGRDEIAPHAREWEAEGTIRRELWPKAAELGLGPGFGRRRGRAAAG